MRICSYRRWSTWHPLGDFDLPSDITAEMHNYIVWTATEIITRISSQHLVVLRASWYLLDRDAGYTWFYIDSLLNYSDKNSGHYPSTKLHRSSVFQLCIHRMSLALFAGTLCGYCCCHGQQVISDICVVAIFVASVLYLIMLIYLLLHLLTAALETSILLHIPNVPCPTTWR